MKLHILVLVIPLVPKFALGSQSIFISMGFYSKNQFVNSNVIVMNAPGKVIATFVGLVPLLLLFLSADSS